MKTGEFGRDRDSAIRFVSNVRHPSHIKRNRCLDNDITRQIRIPNQTFTVAFRASLRKMTNFQVNIVSDTVCRSYPP
jgi:hypothetical protein